jgi:digalactosyldiacylglycerol synthase
MHGYRVLVNPSTSDVVATTTAEALAMGKWVLVADLPCNAFFASRFRNCLTYRTPAEFSARLRHALATDPHPLSPGEAAALSWEAATQRFLDATELTPAERPRGAEAAADRALGAAFNALTGVEPLRELAGAGPGTRDAPPSLDGWAPAAGGGGGIFDSKERLAKAEAKKAAAAGGGGNGGGEGKRGGGGRRRRAALAAAA